MTRHMPTVGEILDENRRDGARTPEQHLEMLIDKFCLAVRAVDPTIDSFWVGRDGDDFKRPFYIHLVRKDSPFNRRPAR